MKQFSIKTLIFMLSVLMLLTAMPLVGFAEGSTTGQTSIPDNAKEFNGHSYAVYGVYKNWNDAKTYCEGIGGHLATITSQEENNFIAGLIKDGAQTQYWLGATDSASEGTWKWITGESFSFTHWGSGSPDNHSNSNHPDENYLTIFKNISAICSWWPKANDFTWNDFNEVGYYTDDSNGLWSSQSQMGFICEWDYLSKPTTSVSAVVSNTAVNTTVNNTTVAVTTAGSSGQVLPENAGSGKDGGSKSWIWILIAAAVLIVIALTVIFVALKKKKNHRPGGPGSRGGSGGYYTQGQIYTPDAFSQRQITPPDTYSQGQITPPDAYPQIGGDNNYPGYYTPDGYQNPGTSPGMPGSYPPGGRP